MLEEKLQKEIEQIIENNGYRLYDIELLKENETKILRISIFNQNPQNSIGHKDCEAISEIISPLLDVYDPINEEYFLEVSSPGIEKMLKKPVHFEYFIHQKIQITLEDKTKISGILTQANDKGFCLDGKDFTYNQIKKAKSIFEWKK